MIIEALQSVYSTLLDQPVAYAKIIGNSQISDLNAEALFYEYLIGTLLVVAVEGIPFQGFYGFHIHEKGICIPTEGYSGFLEVGSHYNPNNLPHPYHAGDLPVLMANYSYAFMMVYSDRFKPEEVINRAIIIHTLPDDYRSQPFGDAGKPMGCGIIVPYYEGITL